MKKTMVAIVLLGGAVALGGCDSTAGTALLGGVGGAAAGAGGYEYHLNQNKQQVEADYKAGKIDKQEHDIRLNQIQRDSFVQ